MVQAKGQKVVAIKAMELLSTTLEEERMRQAEKLNV